MKAAKTDLISLKELCRDISISYATGKNWVRLGKIRPQETIKGEAYFSGEYAGCLKRDIESGTAALLRSRRNKKYVSGNIVCGSYVDETSDNIEVVKNLTGKLLEEGVTIQENEIRVLLAECAVQLFLQQETGAGAHTEEGLHTENVDGAGFLSDYLDGKVELAPYEELVDSLLGDRNYAKEFIRRHPSLSSCRYVYEPGEDVLGLLYLSCKNVGSRKATGSYYTPAVTARHMIDKLCGNDTKLCQKKIFDPCCGTGSFLIRLPEDFQIQHIYGNDIDAVAVKIARINLALRYRPENSNILYENITESDYLFAQGDLKYTEQAFDYILGNPPWGYDFSEEQKEDLRRRFSSASGSNIESYDVFLEKSLADLKENGSLSFVLPEAVMNVRAHRHVRELIVQNTSISYLAYLGNIFGEVLCPCVILQLRHTGRPMSCIGMEVNDGERDYRIHKERTVDPECFCFAATDEEQDIVDKIRTNPGCITLKGRAAFALGIVTGNNKKYLSRIKDDSNEIVLTGSDLYKYKAGHARHYISYSPEAFQQTAPEHYYRAPEKLLYRFVGGRLVFAYDDRQTLSLNSCNIMIPDVEGMSVKYIMTILNSRVAQFIFDKQFGSTKVLRSHIEKIPIPNVSPEEQKEFELYADRIITSDSGEEIRALYDEADRKAASLFGLCQDEYRIVANTVNKKNLFLWE